MQEIRSVCSSKLCNYNTKILMEKAMFLVVVATAILSLALSPSSAQAASSPSVAATPTPSPAPAPAPAPAPTDVNLTQLLSVAGPFSTFLSYLQSTKVIDTFQNQANNSEQGVTIFVPTDAAFSSLKSPSLKNLTSDQLKSLCLFHGLSQYYSLSDFKSLSQLTTFAGGQYTLNFTDTSGTVHISSGWSKTKISSSVFSTSPVALYEVSKVLLPEAIFGTDIPPTPAPAPAPEISPSADSPADSAKSPSSPSSSHSNSSVAVTSSGIWSSLVLAVSGGLVLFFL